MWIDHMPVYLFNTIKKILIKTYPSFILLHLNRIGKGPFKFFAGDPNFYTNVTASLSSSPSHGIRVMDRRPIKSNRTYSDGRPSDALKNGFVSRRRVRGQ